MLCAFHQISVGSNKKSDYKADLELFHDGSLIPEHDLLTAFVQRGYLDLSSNLRKHVQDARKWILSPDNSEWTFIWACDQLDLSDNIRRIIRKAALETYD